ncbi:flagellar assembly protein A, partial [Thermodesulfobacterium hydrogeniphilum]|uniref:flagellar assembly protein A n=1 Tax=Thermodesulfobacterium hydrogeniphilum TaxID=161156 RepID=UPI00056FF19F
MINKKKIKQQGLWIDDLLFRVSLDDMILYLDSEPFEEFSLENLIKKWQTIKDTLKNMGFFGVLDYPEVVENKIVVAKGLPPKPPIPEKIEFFEKVLYILKKEKPEITEIEETKREDLREAYQTIICAEKDEPIGKWYPSIPGIPGTNVFGESIEPPKVEKTSSWIFGKNLYIDENNFIRAKEAGVILIENNKIEIYPEYT